MKLNILFLFLSSLSCLPQFEALSWDKRTLSEVFPENITTEFSTELQGTLCLDAFNNFVKDVKKPETSAIDSKFDL